MHNDDELALLAQAQKGDEWAIAKIVEKYKGLVIALARRRYLSGGDLEDLIQEGTLGLVKAIRQYSPERGNFCKFASISIINKINDAVRADNRNRNKALNESISFEELTLSQDWEDDKGYNPLTVYLSNEKRNKFYENINSILSTEQMEILQLYLEGYTYKEIGQKLNITEKKVDNGLLAIKNRIRKAEAKFIDESGY